MKKFSLLLCCFVALLVSQRSNATVTITKSGDIVTVSTSSAGDLTAYTLTSADQDALAASTIKFVGKFNSDDLDALTGYYTASTVDVSLAQFVTSYDPSSSNRVLYHETPSGNNTSTYIAIVGGDLYQSSYPRNWRVPNVDNGDEPIWYTPDSYLNVGAMNADAYNRDLGATTGVTTYKYCQMRVTEGKTEKTGVNYPTDSDVLSWVNSKIAEIQGSYTNGQDMSVTVYFQFHAGTGDNPNYWELCEEIPTSFGENTTVFNGDETSPVANINSLDINNSNVKDGDYIYFTITYIKTVTKEWINDTDEEQPGAKIGNFEYKNRNESGYLNNGEYNHEDWVRMNVITYYRLYEDRTGALAWHPKSYNDGDTKTIAYEFADETAKDNSTPSIEGEFAVVGGTKKMWNGTEWVNYDSSVSEFTDYKQMKFSNWGTNVTTIILPDDITASQCANDIFSGCTNVTSVKSGVTATINRSGSVYAEIMTSDDTEFARVSAILGLDGYVTDCRKVRNVLRITMEDFTKAFEIANIAELTTEALNSYWNTYLTNLTDPTIEYIILPAGVDKDGIFNADYSDLTSLRAVISSNVSSDSKHDLVAYVNVPGSLAEARCLATGNSASSSSDLHPTSQGLTSVALAGKLILNDISVSGESSALYHGGSTQSITKLDLEKAIFVNPENVNQVDCSQMNFNSAGYANLTSIINEIILPTNPAMNTIPENCMQNLKAMTDVCVPYNYEYILSGAFVDSHIMHITTTDGFAPNGAIVDNGEKTYTFSANLKQLGTTPSSLVYGEETLEPGAPTSVDPVFPKERGVKELYSLATKVPVCYRGVFGQDLCFGYGGPDDQIVYCREKYFNNGDPDKPFIVLRFPSRESFTKASVKEVVETGDPYHVDDDAYMQMVKKYMDPYREYTKKDQTGAVDANGEPLLWPVYTESNRSYNQASKNLVWDDYNKKYDGAGDQFINADGTDIHESNVNHYSFIEYAGWHQLVLTQATYVEPKEKQVEDQKAVRNYVQGGWYTFCIPFDMTEDEVYAMLGVPASDNKTINKFNGNIIDASSQLLPDIRTLKGVTRKPGSTNEVRFLLTKNLATDGKDVSITETYEEGDEDNDGVSGEFKTQDVSYIDCESRDGKKILIKGGYPYIIRPYFYLQGDETNASDKKVYNLGKYVMTRFGDKFKQTASCVHNEGTVEPIGAGSNTLIFAKPYEEHKILAVLDKGSKDTEYAKHANGKKYYYTFIGQFWEQRLPLYSFYMSDGRWYRYSSGKNRDLYKWYPYNCIIMATVEDDTDTHTKSGKFRNNETGHSLYPTVRTGTADLLDDFLKLEFMDGLDDGVFDEKSAARGYRFTFDDDIMEIGEDSETTFINNLDGKNILPTSTNSRIYNMAGQYVGHSTEGLSKGMYIVNGKKIIVK